MDPVLVSWRAAWLSAVGLALLSAGAAVGLRLAAPPVDGPPPAAPRAVARAESMKVSSGAKPTLRAQLFPTPARRPPAAKPDAPPPPPVPRDPPPPPPRRAQVRRPAFTRPAPAPDARPPAVEGEPRRIRVRDRAGRAVVARVHGGTGDDVHIMLPDGQLGVPDTLVYTDEPFRPATAEEVARDLLDGPFAGFKVKVTARYVIVYKSTDDFATASAQVLENLYRGLTEAFRRRDMPVHESEFPLVAVIFRTEQEFREFRPVDPEIQAYYEIYTNRIYFYQTSDRDEAAPEVAAMRRPQTVAHEGTHQILQNIGIQPRLAAWPPWLIEGLAEYCATPVTTRRGPSWEGLGATNAQHLATIRDLDDPLSGQVAGTQRPAHIGREPGQPLVAYLVKKTDLTPTDYALAWAMTHYLAMKRVNQFVAYLKTMSRMPPLQRRTPEEHLADFRAAFPGDLAKLDREIGGYLGKLKVSHHLPYYAVMFEQRVPGNLVRRAAIVSQSPSMIRQWLETVSSPRGDPPAWQAVPYPSRTPALAAAEAFVHNR